MSSMAAAAAAKARPDGGGRVGGHGASDDEWVGIQRKTFRNWVNSYLDDVEGQELVKDLTVDWKNGILLIRLLEILSKKSFGRYNKRPKIIHQELENLTNAFKFMEKDGLKFVNIGPGDINEGNLKLILGLIWTIIYHYQIQASFKALKAAGGDKAGQSAKSVLLEWVNSKINPEHHVKNFKGDWNDGKAICALTNAVAGDPQVIPDHASKDASKGPQNAQEGIDKALEYLDIPKLMSGDDLANPNVDDLSVMTYVSMFKTATRKAGGAPAPVAAPVAATPSPVKKPEPVKEAAPAPADGWGWRDPGKGPGKGLPPPWERPADWRKYEGDDLGGRCKIKVYYSTTTHSREIRANFQSLQTLFMREKVHERPDFEYWTPIDVDMDKSLRDKIFAKAGGCRVTPLVFVDDEYIGNYERIMDLNESGELHKMLQY